jgi:hypothetical protein
VRLRIVGGLAGGNQFPRHEEPYWQKTIPGLGHGQVSTEIVAFDKAGIRTNEMLRLIQLGVVPFGTILMGGILTADPELAALDLAGMNPYMAALRRSVGAFRPHLEHMMRERHGIQVLAIYAYPAQVTFCSRPFAGLTDLLPPRAHQQPIPGRPHPPIWSSAAADGVLRGAPGLRSGNVDCAITGAMSGNTIGLHEVATHLHAVPPPGVYPCLANLGPGWHFQCAVPDQDRAT